MKFKLYEIEIHAEKMALFQVSVINDNNNIKNENFIFGKYLSQDIDCKSINSFA